MQEINRSLMPKNSAGLLIYRFRDGELEVFLVHPGGPFWAKKDLGAWSIPKGEFESGEDPLQAARREFQEETGCVVEGPFRRLTPIKQGGGKVVHRQSSSAEPKPGTDPNQPFRSGCIRVPVAAGLGRSGWSFGWRRRTHAKTLRRQDE